MDSEKLHLSPPLPSSQLPQRQRKNLQPESSTSTTYYKQPRRAIIPREPVKAAVKAVEDEKPTKQLTAISTMKKPQLKTIQASTKAQLIPTVYGHKDECVVSVEDREIRREEEQEDERSVEGSTDSQLIQQIANLKDELDVQLKVRISVCCCRFQS